MRLLIGLLLLACLALLFDTRACEIDFSKKIYFDGLEKKYQIGGMHGIYEDKLG